MRTREVLLDATFHSLGRNRNINNANLTRLSLAPKLCDRAWHDAVLFKSLTPESGPRAAAPPLQSNLETQLEVGNRLCTNANGLKEGPLGDRVHAPSVVR